MLDVEDFNAVFAGVNYNDGIVKDIQTNRQALHSGTFFERLLETLNIKLGGHKLYPPKNPRQLQDLHKHIVSAPINLHYKHCLIFYLLKDLSPLHHETTELATAFARDVHLEKRFWTFIEGLWELDHLQFETAVENLTHPSIIPTFPDEIMLTFLRRNDFLEGVGLPGKAAGGDDILPLAYYNCVKPPLNSATVRDDFVRYLSGRNVPETYAFIRTRPAHEQKHLLELLLEETLEKSLRSFNTDESSYTSRDKAMELISLPFDDEEEIWLEKFLTEGKGRTWRGAQDTVQMRRVATGRFADVVRDNSIRDTKKRDGVNWEVLKDGVSRGLGPRKDEGNFAV